MTRISKPLAGYEEALTKTLTRELQHKYPHIQALKVSVSTGAPLLDWAFIVSYEEPVSEIERTETALLVNEVSPHA